MLCGLADGLDAVRAVGVREPRILLIGGAAQNPAVAPVAAQVFDAPVVDPRARRVRRRRRSGAGGVGAHRRRGPAWPLELANEVAADYRPIIREQYAAYAGGERVACRARHAGLSAGR